MSAVALRRWAVPIVVAVLLVAAGFGAFKLLGGIHEDREFEVVNRNVASHYAAASADCLPHLKSARPGEHHTYQCAVRYADGRTVRRTVSVDTVEEDVPCANEPNTHCSEDFDHFTFP
jgi:hypothetical protein